MPAGRIRLIAPECLHEQLSRGQLTGALQGLADSLGIAIEIDTGGNLPADTAQHPNLVPIRYEQNPVGGLVVAPRNATAPAHKVAGPLATMIEHLVEREHAVGDLADALLGSYEELNLLYNFLPNIATKVDPREIGEAIVEDAARTLCCNRVSLLVLDDAQETYSVLSARGLPADLLNARIPVGSSIAAHTLEDDLLVVNDIREHPDLQRLSVGEYDTQSFAVVRVPLTARGEAMGFLTATDRQGDTEFTTRDRKLLEGLSAMGASAILNCRLHAAVNRQMVSTIHALASAVDAKDAYTHDHAGRVSQLAVATAQRMGSQTAAQCREIQLAGLLHDIGKIGIPDAILCKPARLTPEEYKRVQAHVHIGARIISHVPGLERVAEAVRHHHERFDGLGYPVGLVGDQIPRAAAIIAVADTFDALTSDRPYRKADSIDNALREIRRVRGTQHDPAVVDVFVDVIENELASAGGNGQPCRSVLSLQPALTTL